LRALNAASETLIAKRMTIKTNFEAILKLNFLNVGLEEEESIRDCDSPSGIHYQRVFIEIGTGCSYDEVEQPTSLDVVADSTTAYCE